MCTTVRAGALSSADEEHSTFRRAMEEGAARASRTRKGKQPAGPTAAAPEPTQQQAANGALEQAQDGGTKQAQGGGAGQPRSEGVLTSLRQRQEERQAAEASMQHLVGQLKTSRWVGSLCECPASQLH